MAQDRSGYLYRKVFRVFTKGEGYPLLFTLINWLWGLPKYVLGVTPSKQVPEVAAMLKTIHARKDRNTCIEKARVVAAKLRKMKLRKAADLSS